MGLSIILLKKKSRTSTVSSTNFRSILTFPSCVVGTCNNINIKKHSSCEIEYFVETHLSLQAVRDTPIARITGCVSLLRI